jgi:hypothetical protein
MLSGLLVDRKRALRGLEVVLLSERDQRYDQVLTNKSLTMSERNHRIAEIQIAYTKALKEAKEIILEKGS